MNSDQPYYIEYKTNQNLDHLDEEIYYFAYGSNMDNTQMDRRRVSGAEMLSKIGRWPQHWKIEVDPAIPLGVATLKGYRFNFDKASGASYTYASVTPDENSTVEGVLYKLDKKFIKILDYCEGVEVDQYTRELVKVAIQTQNSAEKVFQALIYIAHPNATVEPGRGLPSRSYLNTIIRGAEKFGLNKDWVARLKEWPTAIEKRS